MAGVPEVARFPICVIGIWCCFFAYGILQEGIFVYKSADGEKFKQTLVLLMLEHGISAFVAGIVVFILGQNSKQSMSPFFKVQSIIAGAQTCAKFASNESLKHVSYPIQALAKSSKTIPAMVGCLFSGKHITKIQWLAAVGITGGCAMFSMKGKKGGGLDASTWGIGLLCLSLACDGTVASSQQGLRSMKKMPTAYEQMFMTNFGAILILAPFAAASGQLSAGLTYLMANPAIFTSILTFGICSAFGQVFIFLAINWFGPDTNAKITTIRKMVTVLLSIVWYGHPMTQEQWIAVSIVFGSVIMEVAEKFLAKPHVKDEKKSK